MNKMDSLELDLLCVHTWVECDKGLFIWRTDNFVAFMPFKDCLFIDYLLLCYWSCPVL